ncbi:hypothetical protein [Comamonas sp. UBA7528]|jgi:hypothetical protein|uniref:hypothetical protein n=1 Tax=Comamonas sp. UBA7528 TaxID=1946391 RepID=UPI0025C047FB|nr:hypothetical protein [Comamonas sp. UBA7528]
MEKFYLKLRNFLVIWFIYFSATLGIALAGSFVVLPVLKLIRFGVFELLPNATYLVKVSKAVFFCSFFLSLVMWLWGEIEAKRN